MDKKAYTFLITLSLATSLFLIGCIQDRGGESTSTSTTTAFTTTSTQTTARTTTTSMAAQTTTTTRAIVLNPIVNLSLSTDKNAYKSNELMDINLVADSSHDLDVLLRVYGIQARYYRINKTEGVEFDAGLNEKSFSYRTPSCYGCAGIEPGVYNVTVEVVYNNEVIATATTSVEMQR